MPTIEQEAASMQKVRAAFDKYVNARIMSLGDDNEANRLRCDLALDILDIVEERS